MQHYQEYIKPNLTYELFDFEEIDEVYHVLYDGNYHRIFFSVMDLSKYLCGDRDISYMTRTDPEMADFFNTRKDKCCAIA